MKILDAAILMEQAIRYNNARRAGTTDPGLANFKPIKERIATGETKPDGVQAYLMPGRILVLPGTNKRSDWPIYNLVTKISQFSSLSRLQGASVTARWHSGFLKHAKIVYEFADPLKPKLIIGHSLGGASAQIVGASMGVPCIGFGTPRSKYYADAFSGSEKALTVNLGNDLVGKLPFGISGYVHLGGPHPKLAPSPKKRWWFQHAMTKYVDRLNDADALRTSDLPESWGP